MGKRAFGSIRKLPSGRFQARYVGPDLCEHTRHRVRSRRRSSPRRGSALRTTTRAPNDSPRPN